MRPHGPLADLAVNPLDDTRVHPECYFHDGTNSFDWAQKMCADSTDQDYEQGDLEAYQEIVHEAMDDSRRRMEKNLKRQRRDAFDQADLWKPPAFGTPHAAVIESRKGATTLRDDEADEELEDKLSELDLDGYAKLIEDDHGRRREQLEDVKRELRYPFRDDRKPWTRPSDQQVFDWLACQAEGGRIKPFQIVAARIQRADDWRVFTTTDVGVPGGLHASVLAVSDERIENCKDWLARDEMRPKFDRHLATDAVVECAILKVDPERMRVELSRRDEDVFFPVSSEDFYARIDGRHLDNSFDATAAVADYVAGARRRQDRALRARRDRERRVDDANRPKPVAPRRAITHPAHGRPSGDPSTLQEDVASVPNAAKVSRKRCSSRRSLKKSASALRRTTSTRSAGTGPAATIARPSASWTPWARAR